MIIVDAHCDTLTKIMEQNENLYKNSCHIDIERMKRSGSYVQFFAAFIEPKYCQAYAMKRAVQIIDKLYQQTKEYSDDIVMCCDHREIKKAITNNKIAAVLTIEGGEALQGDLSALRIFYGLGVRSLCLTWNNRNEIADGVCELESKGGLTSFGRDVIKEMNKLGMLIDLSHIAQQGFWDVIELSSNPIIVSHSNAKSICSHKRNLTDDQIIAVKNNGGVIGINLYPNFLNDSGVAKITDVIKHIEHISSLVGCDNLGIGADFDGVEKLPIDINGIEDMYKIFNELSKLNYTEENINKIAGENFIRVIKEVL